MLLGESGRDAACESSPTYAAAATHQTTDTMCVPSPMPSASLIAAFQIRTHPKFDLNAYKKGVHAQASSLGKLSIDECQMKDQYGCLSLG